MLLPCIGIITIEDYKQELNLDAIVLMGTVLTVGNAIVEKDIIDFSMLSGITQLPLFFMILIVAIVVFAGLLVIPIAPSLVSILVPILIGVAGSAEQAAVFTITVALCVQNCYLLPIDTVCLITYGKGHYSMTDMSRIAICVQCVQVVLISEKAFSQLSFMESEDIDNLKYFSAYDKRDKKARAKYVEERANVQTSENELYMIDILRGGIKNGDPRI